MRKAQHCDHYTNDESCLTCPYKECIASIREIYQQIKMAEQKPTKDIIHGRDFHPVEGLLVK